jgi:hypothetical protein
VYEHPYNFEVNRTVELLTGERNEDFEFEKAIRLLEFQTWIYWPQLTAPQPEAANSAGLMAAVFILEQIEEDIYFDEASFASSQENYGESKGVILTDKPDATLNRIKVLMANKTYRKVHDYILAARGGLPRLLYCPTPEGFDDALAKRRKKARIAAELMDYRLRYAQHGGADGHGTNRHAIFFKWWPTYDVPGKRGATPKNKSETTKTLNRYEKMFRHSAIFIYLNEMRGFSQIPEFGDASGDFVTPLRRAATNVDELRRFFGAYAYVAETIEDPMLIVPDTVPRVRIQTAPFTQTELQTIAHYRRNAVLMDK